MTDNIEPITAGELAELVLAATTISGDVEQWRGPIPKITINHVGLRALRERLLARLDAVARDRDVMAAALLVARDAFLRYERLHRSKGTSEGAHKADANGILAAEMQAALCGMGEGLAARLKAAEARVAEADRVIAKTLRIIGNHNNHEATRLVDAHDSLASWRSGMENGS